MIPKIVIEPSLDDIKCKSMCCISIRKVYTIVKQKTNSFKQTTNAFVRKFSPI